MATKIKKEDFDKYSIDGFKIGDTVWIQEANVQSEVIAVDLDKSCMYNIMIDATQINLKEEDLMEIPIKDCSSDSVYYRRKAFKEKYKIWVNLYSVEHVLVTKTEESVLENKQEEYVNEEDNSIVHSDAFMIEDYLKDDSNIYLEFYLKPKYGDYVSRNREWNNETYVDENSLIEVGYDDAKYIAIVFDSNYSLNNEALLSTFLDSADRMLAKAEFHRTIINNITLAGNTTHVKDLIESIVQDLYVENIIHSYSWNSRGTCAVLVEI